MNNVQLLGFVTAVSLALAWANNEFVMTKELFVTLAGSPHNTVLLDLQYETVRRMSAWGYVLAPLQTAFRIGVVALIAQTICLLSGFEIPFGKMFRISVTAFIATLFGSLLQILWIVKQPVSAINRASLAIVPDSVAAWLVPVDEAPPLLYHALSRASLTSLLWLLLVYWGLRETKRLSPARAAAVTTATWLIVSALSVGTTMMAQELVS